jgi:phosphocarrier protein
MDEQRRTLTILNKKGLHARAAAKFVNVVNGFDAEVEVSKLGASADQPPVSGSSILGLMMLGAETGSKVELVASGVQAAELVDALAALLAGKFGEE